MQLLAGRAVAEPCMESRPVRPRICRSWRASCMARSRWMSPTIPARAYSWAPRISKRRRRRPVWMSACRRRAATAMRCCSSRGEAVGIQV